MRIGDLLTRNPFRPLESVVKITDHDPRKVWAEVDEYIPTETLKHHFREILDVLTETRRGATERVCIWVSGFFGSGKSHFLKVLGYLLEDREIIDPDGHPHSSSELLCRKLGLETFLPILTREFRTKVLYINLLDHDPQNQERPTFSRLILRSLHEHRGLASEFWLAAWEKELQQLGKWEDFQVWVRQTYGRTWREECRLNAEVVLKRALPCLLSDRYRTEEEAAQAVQESKLSRATVTPSEVTAELRRDAEHLEPHKGRLVVMLDEAGLYIGDSKERLTDLNALAEQVVQQGEGKVLLIATAQEALPDLVPRLTTDRQFLEWLRDRFRLRPGIEPTEVQTVVANRLLAKKGEAAAQLQNIYRSCQGALLSNLNIDRQLTERDFVEQYPCPPYAVKLVQDVMGAMRGSVEDARRLSGSNRSLLKLVQAILTGEGGRVPATEREVGWLVSLDLFYDALAPDLSAVRSEQVRIIRDLEQLGEVNGLPVARLAKVLYLLQHLRERFPCTVENLAAALVDRVDADIHMIREAVRQALQHLQQEGWVAEEEGRYRLLTPAEHDLEREVRTNYPGPAGLKEGAVGMLKEMLSPFRYEHGQIRRPLKVALTVDSQTVKEEGDLAVSFFTPLAEETWEDVLSLSIGEPDRLFWIAAEQAELRTVLERTLAIKKTLDQWQTRVLPPEKEEHRHRLEREAQVTGQTRLPQLIQQAFLQGRLFLGGQELTPSGGDLASVLRTHLHTIAAQLYTGFIDDRPDRDEDCAAILDWRAGAALPAAYIRLGLLTTANQINQDAGPLATVKAELTRRQQRGLPTTGKDLLEHFEKKPYGWDPRLLRLLLATLFKAGLLGVRYQNRDLNDAADPQARLVFNNAREFPRAVFTLLPAVDWRSAGELCSVLFGVPGGDTFERTAAVVQEQAKEWAQEAGQLATRCQDNGLPASFAASCTQTARCLGELAGLSDPNARLRRFLELADTLGQQMPPVSRLKGFPFAEYRRVHSLVQAGSDWAADLAGEAAQRWQRLQSGLKAGDLPERWDQIRQDYAFLLGRYRESYGSAHCAFQEAVQRALDQIYHHEAFQYVAEAAEQALSPLKALKCDAGPTPGEETFRCPACQRSFAALALAAVQSTRRQVESALDALLPKLPEETIISPLVLHRTISQESDLDALVDELRCYWRRARCAVDVEIKAQIGGEEA